MKHTLRILLAAFCVFCLSAPRASAAGEPTVVKAPIVRVDMFKNGFAVITHEVAAASTQILIDGLHNPAHGTMWVQSQAPVSMKFFNREEKEFKDTPLSSMEILESLKGQWVEITLANEDMAEGVLKGVTSDGAFVVLESEEGTELYKAADISGLYADKKIRASESKETTARKPSVLLTSGSGKQQKVMISYLTRGISWAPSYRLDLFDKNKGRLQMNTVVRNELADMDNAEFFLISGFPSIKFKDVSSPANANTSWSQFFSALSGSSYSSYPGAMAQQMVMNAPRSMDFAESSAFDAPDVPTGDFDVHYMPAGKHSLELNQALVLPLGDESISYERVIEWNIADNADAYGNFRKPGSIPDDIELMQDVWDAVKFKNPFKFPMTTAAISMYQNNAFLGQSQSSWTAPGQEVFTRITKAMNVKVDHTESEIQGKREDVRISGSTYTKTQVKATVTVKNNRGRKDKIIIRRHFSGRLLEVTGSPEKALLPEGATRLNERNKLVWETELDPGKEVQYTYTYEIVF
jgi:hypothetical protein